MKVQLLEIYTIVGNRIFNKKCFGQIVDWISLNFSKLIDSLQLLQLTQIINSTLKCSPKVFVNIMNMLVHNFDR